MEESKEIWKGYIIVRQGSVWRVRNYNRYVGGSFTMLSKAKAWIDGRVNDDKESEWKTAIRRIRRIKDLNKRSKEYKKLCQEMQRCL